MLSVADAAAAGQTAERIRMSPLAWAAAAVLLFGAIYFIIRLMELDQVNRETENQDDPLQR